MSQKTENQTADFQHTGRVIRSEILAGSFRRVKLEGHKGWYTVGLNDSLRHPLPGDVIIVTGILHNGRLLTESWDFI